MTSNKAEGAGHHQCRLQPALRIDLPANEKSDRCRKNNKKPFFTMNPKSPAERTDRQQNSSDRQQKIKTLPDPKRDPKSGSGRQQKRKRQTMNQTRNRNRHAEPIDPSIRFRFLF